MFGRKIIYLYFGSCSNMSNLRSVLRAPILGQTGREPGTVHRIVTTCCAFLTEVNKHGKAITKAWLVQCGYFSWLFTQQYGVASDGSGAATSRRPHAQSDIMLVVGVAAAASAVLQSRSTIHWLLFA